MASTSTASSHDANDRFFRYFQHEVTDLQEQIERISEHSTTGGESTDALEHCSAGVVRLSNEVRDTIATLPTYDRQTYSDAIKALSTKLQAVKSQQSRKQKFSFKSSAFKIPKNESAVSLHDAAELASQRRTGPYAASTGSSLITTPLEVESPVPERADEMSEGREGSSHTGEYIMPESTDDTFALAADIHCCVLDLSARLLPTFRLRNITESIVVVPQVTGPIYLEGVSKSIIVAGCHQFRMHNSSQCEVYLHCSSRPIIEDCTGVAFAPMPEQFAVDGARENRWDQIDDFKWLRAEHSPNWSVLEHQRRRGPDFWKTVAGLKNEKDLGASLAGLGLP